jgi:integrase
MNRKGNRTTTGFIPWEEFQRLMDSLTNEKIKLVAAISTYAGLRISDVLNLKWSQLSGQSIVLVEKKTKKTREIAIHETLREILGSTKSPKTGYVVKSNMTGRPISISYINRKLKEEFDRLNIQYDGNISSHMFRKTMGRRFLDQSDYQDKALILLMDLFGHTSLAVTKRYLGIRQEEINQVYLTL